MSKSGSSITYGYNADGKRCHADHIQVKNTQGTCSCKDETFCSTFTKKGSAAF